MSIEDKTVDINLVDEIMEFLYSTPEEVIERAKQREKDMMKKKLILIEGGKK